MKVVEDGLGSKIGRNELEDLGIKVCKGPSKGM